MTKNWVIICSAISGGLLFNYFKVPAGAMVGSLIGTAIAQMASDTKLEVPQKVKRFIRYIMGCYIGLGITLEGVQQFKNIMGAVSIVIGGILVVTIIVTFFIYKYTNLSLVEAFLSSLPAGLSEIGMNAEEFKVDPLQLTTIHFMRLITTLILIPLIVNYLNR